MTESNPNELPVSDIGSGVIQLRELSDEELLQLMESSEEYSRYALGMEYLRRHKTTDSRPIRAPADILPLVVGYARRKQEHFLAIPLDGAHAPMTKTLVSRGLVNRTLIHPREVYRAAIKKNAVALIVAHNHPSGNVVPSEEDKLVTKRLMEAGEVVGIRLLDHIIFAEDGYFSFLEHGMV